MSVTRDFLKVLYDLTAADTGWDVQFQQFLDGLEVELDSLADSIDTNRSASAGTQFPGSPVQGQVCVRTDRGHAVYRYTGDTEQGEAGWVDATALSLVFQALKSEVESARGLASTLAARLDVSTNLDGTLKGDAPAGSWWMGEADAVTYQSASSFGVGGDKTAIYLPRRSVRLSQSGGPTTTHVAARNYDSNSDVTTVSLEDAVVATDLAGVAFGQQPGNEPGHTHDEYEAADPNILKSNDIGAKVVAPQARSQAPRQAILTCPTDANGLPDFLADNAGDLEIQASASAPLTLSFAEGFGQDGPLDGYLRLTAPLTVPASALTNDTRNYVFINGDGTAGVTTMRPQYGPHRAGVDRVPTMSANSQDGITLSASSVYDSSYEPYMAFNDSIGEEDRWVTQDGVSTGWLQAAFPEARRVDGYTLQCPAASKAGSMPNTWTFEGSDDGATWTELDAQTGVTWTGQEVKRFSLATPGQWRCVRINVTALNGGSVLNIGEMEILGSGDFFDLVRMEMRDSADVVVPRVYGGYCDVDSSGNITGTYSYAPGTFAVRAVNGGANIGTNQRHEEENPFGHGMPIHAVAQIKPEGDEWGHNGFTNTVHGCRGMLGQPYAGNIVVQTGDDALCSSPTNDGSPFLNAGKALSAPCRIKVWRAF